MCNNGGDTVPVETFSLNVDETKWTYTEQDSGKAAENEWQL